MARDYALERFLRDGEITLEGRLWQASNATFKGVVSADGKEIACVYKPIAGERPLRDFPSETLAFREVAAYVLSEVTGWSIVPTSVLREGPHGPGMAQRWIETDPAADVEDMLERRDPRLRRIAVFDAIVNNTDRKGGHLLVTSAGHVHGVDHGVTFSTYPKLRTILWSWRGQDFDPDELRVLRDVREAIDGALGEELRGLLDGAEVDATTRRLDDLLASRTFPQPNPNWPAVPWPPF